MESFTIQKIPDFFEMGIEKKREKEHERKKKKFYQSYVKK